MANISIKLNLQQLKHVERKMKGKDGKEIDVLVIPVDANNLFRGEKGTYLNLTAIELKNKKTDSKDTHLIKQEVPKEVYDKMSEEQRKAAPIMGNAILWARREPDPQTFHDISAGTLDDDQEDDLPF